MRRNVTTGALSYVHIIGMLFVMIGLIIFAVAPDSSFGLAALGFGVIWTYLYQYITTAALVETIMDLKNQVQKLENR